MELQHRENIEGFQRLSNDFDRQLKLVGIELTDIPDDCVVLLDRYAEIRSKTGLARLEKSQFDQFYYEKSLEYIEHKRNRWQIEKDIRNLEKQIDTEKESNRRLKESLEQEKQRRTSEEELDKKKSLIERQIDSLKERNEKFKTPSDFNFDELLNKIEKLEAHKKSAKPSSSKDLSARPRPSMAVTQDPLQ